MNPKVIASRLRAANVRARWRWANTEDWEFWLDKSPWWALRLRHREEPNEYMTVSLNAFGGSGLAWAAARMSTAVAAAPLPHTTIDVLVASMPLSTAKQLLGVYVAWLLLEEEE